VGALQEQEYALEDLCHGKGTDKLRQWVETLPTDHEVFRWWDELSYVAGDQVSFEHSDGQETFFICMDTFEVFMAFATDYDETARSPEQFFNLVMATIPIYEI